MITKRKQGELSRDAKRAKAAYPCRVCLGDCTDYQQSIYCDGCQTWMHISCINMSPSQLEEFGGNKILQFYCRRCCHLENGQFNAHASLLRIGAFTDAEDIRNQAITEKTLLTFYNVSLPPVQVVNDIGNMVTHADSVNLLHDNRTVSWLVARFIPVSIIGDGNCLFRSVSLLLFGCEDQYMMLRLLCVCEVDIITLLVNHYHV